MTKSDTFTPAEIDALRWLDNNRSAAGEAFVSMPVEQSEALHKLAERRHNGRKVLRRIRINDFVGVRLTDAGRALLQGSAP